MLRWIYNLLLAIALCLTGPFRLWRIWRRGEWEKGFLQRCGRYGGKFKQAITNRQVIWLHVAGAGEAKLCTQLIRAIELRAPNLTIIVSVDPSADRAALERSLPPRILSISHPIDRRDWVRRAFRVVRPCAVVLVGVDLRPNFMWEARGRRVPVFLVGSRFGPGSLRSPRRFGALFRPLFASLAGAACANEEQAAVLRSLGCQPEALRMVGEGNEENAAFDEQRVVDVPLLLARLGVSAHARVLVGAHTQQGEEAILAGTLTRLRARFPDVFLVVVPAQRERAGEAGRDIRASGLRFVFRSEITPDRQYLAWEVECLVVNTSGELRSFYQHATVVFLGRHRNGEDGQKPLDPALMAKPIVFGPDGPGLNGIAQKLVSGQGAFQAANEGELEATVARLLSDEKFARESGQKARLVAKEHMAWMERIMDMILEHLRAEEVYVVDE